MAIISAEIIGTRMAEVGSGGYTINSTFYSVLVFHDSGLREIVEGSAEDIRPYLPYMKPRDMKPREDFSLLKPLLNEFEEKIKQDISSIVQQALRKIDNPLPTGITGKSIEEAKAILEAAGFKVETEYAAPKSTYGTVLECCRKENNLTSVILKIKYVVPDIIGMTWDKALAVLREAGFSTTTKRQFYDGIEPGTVANVEIIEGTLNVTLYVCDNKDFAEREFIKKMNQCDTMSEIWSLWKASGLENKHKKVNEMIEQEKQSEEKYGKTASILFESTKMQLKIKLLEN